MGVWEILGGLVVAEAQSERLALATEQAKVMEAENARLKSAIARLEAENAELKRERQARLEEDLATKLVSEQFVEELGILWKRKADGKFESMPYWPRCRHVMCDFAGKVVCSDGHFVAPIRTFMAGGIAARLSAEKGPGTPSA